MCVCMSPGLIQSLAKPKSHSLMMGGSPCSSPLQSRVLSSFKSLQTHIHGHEDETECTLSVNETETVKPHKVQLDHADLGP